MGKGRTEVERSSQDQEPQQLESHSHSRKRRGAGRNSEEGDNPQGSCLLPTVAPDPIYSSLIPGLWSRCHSTMTERIAEVPASGWPGWLPPSSFLTSHLPQECPDPSQTSSAPSGGQPQLALPLSSLVMTRRVAYGVPQLFGQCVHWPPFPLPTPCWSLLPCRLGSKGKGCWPG